MKSYSQELQDRLDAAVEAARHDPDEGVQRALEVIQDQRQANSSRRACGCYLSSDGMTTIVAWPCRQHWWAEMGPVAGVFIPLFGVLAVCFAIAIVSLLYKVAG